MKYGYYDFNESPSSIEDYTDGAHIIVLRKVTDFFKNTCILEDIGWSVRDSIKVITKTESFNATLFRKPFKGTVANNVLENGCGGINIDASRITPPEGRFPANLILIHPNCQKIGVKTVKGTPSEARKKKTTKFTGVFGVGGVATGKAGHGDENGNEIIANYDCVADCPCKKLDVGGASRYFKQVHSLEELKEYLVALIRC